MLDNYDIRSIVFNGSFTGSTVTPENVPRLDVLSIPLKYFIYFGHRLFPKPRACAPFNKPHPIP